MSIADRVRETLRSGRGGEALKGRLRRHQEFAEEMQRQGVIKRKRYNIVSPSVTNRKEVARAALLVR